MQAHIFLFFYEVYIQTEMDIIKLLDPNPREFSKVRELKETLGRTIVHSNDCSYFAHVPFLIKPFESLYFSENNFLNL